MSVHMHLTMDLWCSRGMRSFLGDPLYQFDEGFGATLKYIKLTLEVDGILSPQERRKLSIDNRLITVPCFRTWRIDLSILSGLFHCVAYAN